MMVLDGRHLAWDWIFIYSEIDKTRYFTRIVNPTFTHRQAYQFSRGYYQSLKDPSNRQDL